MTLQQRPAAHRCFDQVKCDRGCPCGNCRDAETRCLRKRQKPPKRLKGPPADKLRSSASDPTIPEVNTALNILKSRLARLEEAATYCHHQNREDGDHVSRSNPLRDPLHFDSAVTGASDNLLTSKKRKCAESHALSSLTVAVPADPELPSKQSSGADDVKLPHSAVDARDLIQDQLSFNKAISARHSQSRFEIEGDHGRRTLGEPTSLVLHRFRNSNV
jgi:hypothetical protein